MATVVPTRAKVCLAVDLGAESVRVVAGSYDGRRLGLEEVHRFPNDPVAAEDGLHWDIERLFAEVKVGISKAVRRFGTSLVSLGVDSWGLDYGLLDQQGKLLANPFHYRDRRTETVYERVLRQLGRDTIYESTGVQFMAINTLYQLVAEKESRDSILSRAQSLLFIPDLINYWLTGRRMSERTLASTSQFYNPRTRTWAANLLEALCLPEDILCNIQDAGTLLGPMLEDVTCELGAGPLEIVLVGTHDTASAVAAVPAGEGNWAYISSGTWSLMGVEVPDPIVNAETRGMGLGNEVGVFDTIRLLKNIAGMWLLQQCRRSWGEGEDQQSYDEMTQAARSAPPFAAIIDPDDARFARPGDMPARIRAYCDETGQQPPATRGALVRTILESLALRYRWTLDGLENVLGHPIEVVHVVGGGSRNDLLNQFAADSLGRPVLAGPTEATAIGNVLLQLHAIGEINSLREGRELVRRSFKVVAYNPADTSVWRPAYERFLRLIASSPPSERHRRPSNPCNVYSG